MSGRVATSRLAIVMLLTLFVGGCGLDGLQFVADERVRWVTEDRLVTTLPLELSWALDGYDLVGADGSRRDDAGYVAIFLDREPQPPSTTLDLLAERDDDCQADPSCPDQAWFHDHGIYPVTDGTTLQIDHIRPPVDEGRRETHDLTLVLLDGTGRRQGESAFRITVEIERPGTAGRPSSHAVAPAVVASRSRP